MLNTISRVLAIALLVAACGGEKHDTSFVPDTTAPATVHDLAAFAVPGRGVRLGWTAPGDDGDQGRATAYEVRVYGAPLSEANWDSAAVAASPPTPQEAGRLEQFLIRNLDFGTWYFAVQSVDEVGNRSAMSNVASFAIVDQTAPSAVTDLAVTGRSVSSLILTWTAPGDDAAQGQASTYDLRHAPAPITEATWSSATQVVGVPAPRVAGSSETFEVTNLEPATLYYFAIKTRDRAGNTSTLSNVASESTENPQLVRLTNSPHSFGAFGPEWSPDGSRVLFQADWITQGVPQAYLVASTGGTPVQLTHAPLGINGPEWSPDGSRIALSLLRKGDERVIADLAIMAADPDSAPVVLVPAVNLGILICAWSPIGDRIAYTVRLTDFPSLLCDIYVLTLSTGASERIAGGWRVDDLAWSPDGTRIAYGSYQAGTSDIWVLPLDGGEPEQLTQGPDYDAEPAWSPDGSRIAFSSDRSGTLDLWLVSAAGGGLTRLTSDPRWDQSPEWSPDGERIVFSSLDPNTSVGDIWVLDGVRGGGAIHR